MGALSDPGEVRAGGRLAMRDIETLASEVLRASDAEDASGLREIISALKTSPPSPQIAGVIRLLELLSSELEKRSMSSSLIRFDPGSLPLRLLASIQATPEATNRDLARATKASEAQISRTGRKLVELGLASQRRRGRTNRWVLTVRGKRAMHSGGNSLEAITAYVESCLRDLTKASTDNMLLAAAERLVDLGLQLRGSSGPRTGLLGAPAQRLSEAQETALINLLFRAEGRNEAALLECLGEWGSNIAVKAIGSRLGSGRTGDVPSLEDTAAALKRVGGAESAQILAQHLGVLVSQEPAHRRESLLFLGALSAVITGGRHDLTEPAELSLPPVQSEVDADVAVNLVNSVSDVLEKIVELNDTDADYLRQRALRSLQDLTRWRVIGDDRSVDGSTLSELRGAKPYTLMGPVYEGQDALQTETAPVKQERESSAVRIAADVPGFLVGELTASRLGKAGAVVAFKVEARVDPSKLPTRLWIVDRHGERHAVRVEDDRMTAIVATRQSTVVEGRSSLRFQFASGS